MKRNMTVCVSAIAGMVYFAMVVTLASAGEVPYDLMEEAYDTQLLWSHSCVDRNMMWNAARLRVFNGNVYLAFIDNNRRPWIAKVAIDGSASETYLVDSDPNYVSPDDDNCFYIIDIDLDGCVHVIGGTHADPMKHWRFDNPEDIFSFTRHKISHTNQVGSNDPPGRRFTYLVFRKDRTGKLLFWSRMANTSTGGKKCLGLSVLDESTQIWTLLGDDIPGGSKNYSVTAWEDDIEDGVLYCKVGCDVAFDSNYRMHMVVNLLNKTPAAPVPSTHFTTEALYAYSDDGGQTIYRSDGTQIL